MAPRPGTGFHHRARVTDILAIVLASAAVFVFLVARWRAAFIADVGWRHWPLVLVVFSASVVLLAAIRGDGLNSSYLPVLVVALAVPILVIRLMPILASHVRVAEASFLFGALVAVSEISSRYKDEPLQACLSPYGIVYVVLNGTISLAALVLILHFNAQFGSIANDPILAALTAGFGSSAVMRTRLAVLKGDDNKDVSIGPDFVLKILLSTVDKYVDRYRAVRRQALVVELLDKMRGLGPFKDAANYLSYALLAFQNIDPAFKEQLSQTFNSYDRAVLPIDIKFMAMGFIFIDLVGESHFAAVLENASAVKTKSDPVAPSPPAPPAPPPVPPPPVPPPPAVPPPPPVPDKK